MQKHISDVHLKLKPFNCQFCPFKTSQKANLHVHSCYTNISKNNSERYIQQKLEHETGGKHMLCDARIIDILTPEYIIEIKNWISWKTAIGQIIA